MNDKPKNEIIKDEEAFAKLGNIMLKVDPASSASFRSPKHSPYPYLDTLFEHDNYKETSYLENGRTIHLMMFPFQTYYHHLYHSYSFLILEFDETEAYEQAALSHRMIFGVWSGVVTLVILTMIMMYRRIISPIGKLQEQMIQKHSFDDRKILLRHDEIGSISNTYNWLLNDLKNEIETNAELLAQFKLFTGNAIHQVRTPLSVIKIALESLDNANNEESKLHIRSSIISMEHLYDSLAFSLRNEQIIFPSETIEINHMLQERVNLFALVASSLDTAIKLTIRNDATVEMNPDELEYLIDNNLSNGLKYGKPTKPIIVTLSQTPSELILGFESYGEPIQNTETIFERYIRHDNSKQGNGIGLNIVESICKRYHIIIHVVYEDGKNCFRYYFSLKNHKM